MGGVCSGGTKRQIAKAGEMTSGKLKSVKNGVGKQNENYYSTNKVDDFGKSRQKSDRDEVRFSFSGELKPSAAAKSGATKSCQKSSFLGRAGIVGLEKTIDVLDTLGSSMSNLNATGGFVSGVASRGNKITIIAFEVANTIAKGANLFQSLSEDNVQFLKKEILHSEGVEQLVSTDIKELLSIAAADKREELDVFSGEVVRFGNLCKDPQWHNLDRYFSNFESGYLNHKQLREEAETKMQELITLAQHTSELYHELNALDRFEQDYRRKLEEVDSLNLPRKGETLTILHTDLKQQRKLVRSLRKKSLWSRNLEEIMEKLVDIATYMHQSILEAFGRNATIIAGKEPEKIPQRLGVAGLALHYANVINQIDNIASRPTSLPPNMRDSLYNGLPTNVKTAIRSQLQAIDANEELSAFQVKAEMEKTLQWLAPLAANTTKAHQGFGWVGEWANSGHEFGKSIATNINPTRLQTLYHADKQKTDKFILDLVIWLHRLISIMRNRDYSSLPQPASFPTGKGKVLHSNMQRNPSLNNFTKPRMIQLSEEERNMLDKACRKGLVLGRSKSLDFAILKKVNKVCARTRSAGNSPTKGINPRPCSENPNLLDVMDGLDPRF
ncbi:hypothetical protein ACOSP7_011139 [Xanthoceras sorbifolium]|uniref:Uncharacterized protein n=1 Tax=Xanthoceras sorbifolium TaxID=99658 RepID=A0ABQ8HS29_9ROSI|nr:hypothetical protein JRO89_XS07G0021200 [Xanthoceras sorbifolium]